MKNAECRMPNSPPDLKVRTQEFARRVMLHSAFFLLPFL